MKKNIAIVILSITTLLGFVYGMAQKTIADKNAEIAFHEKQLADRTMEKAQEAEAEAIMQARMARIMADSARIAAIRAQEALEKCK